MPNKKIPAEIISAINAMLLPYGESYTSPGAGESASGYKSARDAWRYLGVSKSTFYRLVMEGTLRGIKLNKGAKNGKVVFAVSDLERYIASCR